MEVKTYNTRNERLWALDVGFRSHLFDLTTQAGERVVNPGNTFLSYTVYVGCPSEYLDTGERTILIETDYILKPAQVRRLFYKESFGTCKSAHLKRFFNAETADILKEYTFMDTPTVPRCPKRKLEFFDVPTKKMRLLPAIEPPVPAKEHSVPVERPLPVVSPTTCIKNFLSQIDVYFVMLLTSLKVEQHFTDHTEFLDLDTEDKAISVLLLQLLPYCVRRTRLADNLPSLYIYGASGAKALLLTSAPYRKLNQYTTETGMTLTENESAYHYNSPPIGWSLGNQAKVLHSISTGGTFMADTPLRGFLTLTSETTPEFLDYNGSGLGHNDLLSSIWKRNFLCCRMDLRLLTLLPLEKACKYTHLAAKRVIVEMFERLKSSTTASAFKMYINAIKDSITEQETDLYNTAANQPYNKA